jgi:hypothetical protein
MGLDISLIRIISPNDSLNKIYWENSPLEEKYGHLKESQIVDTDIGPQVLTVWYYEQLGYQRKGVKPEFYSRYKPDDVIFTKAELEELCTFIDNTHKTTFIADFMDKFIEGDTIVDISY